MKKVIFAMAAVALLASCSKNEVTNLNVSSTDAISLTGTTTRATIANVSDLQANGFTVYGTSADVTDAWYSDGTAAIDGANKHVYNAGTWNFATPVKWPTDAARYPMNFYAVYPDPTVKADGFSSFTPSASAQTIKGVFNVKPTAAEQIDLLGATATASAKPMSSNLSITFRHLLSKVDFGLNVATDHMAHVQGLAINNVSGQGLADYTASSSVWNMIDNATNRYTYSGMIHANPTGNPAANTFPTPWIGTGTAEPIFPGVHNNHLMLMPQTDSDQNWITTNPNTVEPEDKSHVVMVYRLAKTGDENYIGYADASDHPAYAGSALKTENYTGALFVKVGYPFTLDWKEGKGYIYNVTLPGSGGYLLDQNYYDEDGNRTDLVVGDEDGDNNPDGPKVPEALTGDDYIHLVPVVDNWDDQPANALN
ncbi:MAG: fimbrillin family protein [Rikenellaceae bacterium]|nr:fimbrillin family protein [Rikenellaceae bacterium]